MPVLLSEGRRARSPSQRQVFVAGVKGDRSRNPALSKAEGGSTLKIHASHKPQLTTKVSSRPESAVADAVEGSVVASQHPAVFFIIPGADTAA
jgi:hypothetical protein